MIRCGMWRCALNDLSGYKDLGRRSLFTVRPRDASKSVREACLHGVPPPPPPTCPLLDTSWTSSQGGGGLPGPATPTKKGSHHRSEFHRERIDFAEVRMSAILKINGQFFCLKVHIFSKRGSMVLNTYFYLEKVSVLEKKDPY